MATSSLWTPDGEVSIRERDVTPVTREEIILLSKLHEFAVKHDIVIFCKRCEKNISGQNNATTRTLSVACQCREFRHYAG